MPAPEVPPSKGLPRGLLPVSVGLSVLALALFIGALWLAKSPDQTEDPDALRVSVTENLCDPMEMTVPAGRHSFVIHNAAEKRPLEWEILDGVMVLAERENIAPGFSAKLSVRLSPGEYEITCGLLSAPHGKLIVTPTEASAAEDIKPPVRALLGPLSEFKVRMMSGANRLAKTSAALAEAAHAGDKDKARTLYAEARGHWRQIEPLARRFGDLAARIDPAAAYLAKGEDDPGFIGFHRIEAALWGDRDGLTETAEALAADTAELAARIKDYRPEPTDIAGLSADFANHLADAVVPEGESRFNGQDGVELDAALTGLAKNAALLAPLMAASHGEINAGIEATVAELSGQIKALSADYHESDTSARDQIAAGFHKLAGLLTQANRDMGLED